MLTNEMIGKRIKDYRETKNISQQAFVDKLKQINIAMSRETLSKIENGNRTISAIELNGICSLLGISSETILEDNEEENLVTLFRKKKAGAHTLENVEALQEIITSFMNQKKILKNSVEKKSAPLWRI